MNKSDIEHARVVADNALLADREAIMLEEIAGLQRDMQDYHAQSIEDALKLARQRQELTSLNRVVTRRKFAQRRLWNTLNAAYLLHGATIVHGQAWCTECDTEWPCRTVNVLKGRKVEFGQGQEKDPTTA